MASLFPTFSQNCQQYLAKSFVQKNFLNFLLKSPKLHRLLEAPTEAFSRNYRQMGSDYSNHALLENQVLTAVDKITLFAGFGIENLQ